VTFLGSDVVCMVEVEIVARGIGIGIGVGFDGVTI
jgi:hypothetical protein